MPEMTPTPADLVREQQLRQERLEARYLLDGRDDPTHPLHGLFTGLAQQYAGTASK